MLKIEETFQLVAAMGPVHLKVFTHIIEILTRKYQIKLADFDIEKSIFFYGVDSLKIIEIHSTLEEQLDCQISTESFFSANTFKGMIEDIVQSISNSHDSEPQTGSYSLMVEIDNALEDLLKHHSGGEISNQDKQESITLLTGASGFVGSYFLKELLDTTNLKVLCLVRAADEEAGLQRIKKTVQKYDIKLPHKWESRVQVVIGDISKKQFGLPDYLYQDYTKMTDSVYHVAAVDNFYLPYNIIKKTNVAGTIEVAKFALSGQVKPLYHVSSCAASLFENIENAEQSKTIGLINGYAQTKYVTEQIILQLAKKGFPCISFRLGYLYPLRVNHVDKNISFNKLLKLVAKAYENVGEEFFVESDAFENFLNAIPEIKCLPDLDANFDLIPVEYAAKAIIATSRLSASKKKSNYTFYNPHPLNWSDIVSYFEKYDKRIELVPLTIFVDKYAQYVRQTDNNGIKLLKSVVSSDLEKQLNTMFRDINTDIADEYLSWCPPCDRQFTHYYIDLALNA